MTLDMIVASTLGTCGCLLKKSFMRTPLAFAAFTIAVAALGADTVPYHPFRQIGTNYYDLRRLYAWRLTVQAKARADTNARDEANGAALGAMTTGKPSDVAAANAAAARSHQTVAALGAAERSCPIPQWIIPGGPTFRVQAVWQPDMLLLRGAASGSAIVLRHYPAHDQLADGDSVSAYAMRTGIHRWTDREGVTHSLPLYDYGIPFTPTNSPPAINRQQPIRPKVSEGKG